MNINKWIANCSTVEVELLKLDLLTYDLWYKKNSELCKILVNVQKTLDSIRNFITKRFVKFRKKYFNFL